MSVELASKFEEAADLIRKGWCQGSYALNADGQAVGILDPTATQYCMMGALSSLALSHAQIDEFGDWFRAKVSPIGPPNWNDTQFRQKRDVIAVLRNYAKELRANG